jgi:hypothetical protein
VAGAVSVLGRAKIERRPGLAAHGVIEVCRHDADDRECLPVQVQALADDAGIGSKVPLPKAVAQNHDRRTAGIKIAGIDSPP